MKLDESNGQIIKLNQDLFDAQNKEQQVAEKYSALELALTNAQSQVQRLEISLAEKPKENPSAKRRMSIRPQTAAWIKSSPRGDVIPEETRQDIEELLARAQAAEEEVKLLQKQLDERDHLIKGDSENVGRLSTVIKESHEQLQQMSNKILDQEERASHLKSLIEKLENNVKASMGRAIKAESALQVK